MKNLREKVSELSSHLQRLMKHDVFPQVVEAARRSDKDLLIEACKNAEIPAIYIGSIVSLILALSPQQKYPLVV